MPPKSKKYDKYEKGINELQMGLFSEVIRLKCISDHFPSFWKKYLFETMLVDEGSR